MSRFPLLLAVVILGGVAAWDSLAIAQNAPAARPPSEIAGEQKIRAALDETTTLEYIETPLADVVEVLKDQHQIPIQISVKALDEVGLSTAEPITKNIRGVSLRTALRLLLADLNLTYVVSGEVLLVTTQADAATRPATRVIAVHDLVPDDATSADPLAVLLRTMVKASRTEGAPPPLSISPYGPLLILRGTEEQLDEVTVLLWRMRSTLAAAAKEAAMGGAPPGGPPAQPPGGPPSAPRSGSAPGEDPYGSGDPFGAGAPPPGAAPPPPGAAPPGKNPFGPATKK